jgi:hypothetical protein
MAKKTGKSTKTKKSVKAKPNKKLDIQSGKKSTAAVSKGRGIKPKMNRRKLPNSFKIAKAACNVIWQNKLLFISLGLIYAFLNLALVQGFSNSGIGNLKTELNNAFYGHQGSVASGIGVFTVLLGSVGSSGSNQAAGGYQIFLGLIISLAIIWGLRHVMTGKKVRIRDTFYLGMYPLVPFILIFLLVILELIPLIGGAAVYSLINQNGIAVGFLENLLCAIGFALLAFASIYMLSSSLFGLYIVTLPDMTPLKALRSARNLVKHRRLRVITKILALPVFLIIVATLIMLPLVLWVTWSAQWVFFLLKMFALIAIHAYMYTLYRELLND